MLWWHWTAQSSVLQCRENILYSASRLHDSLNLWEKIIYTINSMDGLQVTQGKDEEGGNHAVKVNGITFLNNWILFLLNFLFCFFHIPANSKPLNCWTSWCIMKISVEKFFLLYIWVFTFLCISVDSSMRDRGQRTKRLQNYWLMPLSVPVSVL